MAFLTGTIWLWFRPDLLTAYHYERHVISLTHLIVLGGLMSVVMGALYQLAPVALETQLHSKELGRLQFWFHAAGVAGLVWMFWWWQTPGIAFFGAIFALGAGLFIYNILRTLARVPRGNVIAFGIAASMAWLGFTVLLGLFLAAAKMGAPNWFAPLAQMHAHAHAGIVGVFVMLTLTVSFKLVPMFTLSEIQNPARIWTALILLNLGLAGAVTLILISSPWKIIPAMAALAGIIIYGIELKGILKHRKRRVLDWALIYLITAMALLIPVTLLGVVLCQPGLSATSFTTQLEKVYGLLGIFGVVLLALMGMLFKIVPFLVWQKIYSCQIGRRKVPALADLYSVRLQQTTFLLFLPGLIFSCVFILQQNQTAAKWSWTAVVAGLILFFLNICKILAHLIRPETKPLTFPVPATTTQ
jgi:hypothetical protein